MKDNLLKKAIKILAIPAAAIVGVITATAVHKGKEGNTRKKAMDAALHENNKACEE